jgi:hypothetical protein
VVIHVTGTAFSVVRTVSRTSPVTAPVRQREVALRSSLGSAQASWNRRAFVREFVRFPLDVELYSQSR